MAPRETICPVCQGTGRVVVPVGSAFSDATIAVLSARYDPATGVILHPWTEVAAICGETLERVRMRGAEAVAWLRRWERAAQAGVPLTDEAAAALATWHILLRPEAYRGRYRPQDAR